MSLWWQKHSRRTWLVLLYATAGDVVLALCAAAAYGLGIWNPEDHQSALLVLIGGGGVGCCGKWMLTNGMKRWRRITLRR
jgi:hypothetical protein